MISKSLEAIEMERKSKNEKASISRFINIKN